MEGGKSREEGGWRRREEVGNYKGKKGKKEKEGRQRKNKKEEEGMNRRRKMEKNKEKEER